MRTLFLFLMIGPASALAQGDHTQVCQGAASVSLPPEAEIPKPSVFPVCDAYKSYAGIGRPVNYAAARACAWKERAAQMAGLPQNAGVGTSWAIGGDLILVNLYANGLSVPRNLPLALHLACEEKAGIAANAIDDLEKLSKAPRPPGKRYNVCDSAYSTFSMDFCGDYRSQIAEEGRKRAIRRLSAQWTQEQKSAFARVETAEREYVSVHSRELDQGGTIHALRDLGSAEIMHNNFLLDLRQFEKGDLPHKTDAAAAESRMANQYDANVAAAQLTAPAGESGTAVTPDGIARVQTAWRHYRNAWLAFATVRYQAVAPAVFRAYFADERYRLLAEMRKQIYRD